MDKERSRLAGSEWIGSETDVKRVNQMEGENNRLTSCGTDEQEVKRIEKEVERQVVQ